MKELAKLRFHLATASGIGKKLCHPDSPNFPDVNDDPLEFSSDVTQVAKCTLQAINACRKLESYHRIIHDSIGETYGMSRREKGDYFIAGCDHCPETQTDTSSAPTRGPTVDEVD